MSYGDHAYGALSYSDTAESLSVGDKLSLLLDDPDAERIYLLEATPYDPDTASEVTVRYGSDALHTGTGDSPANTTYEPRLSQPFNFQASLFGKDILSGASASFGALKLINTDSALDPILDYYWDGRSVVIKAGTSDFAFSEFETIFTGRVDSIEWTEKDITLRLRDPRTQLDKVAQTTLYAGTGGDEGDSALKGRPKPQVYGHAREVRCVLVDSVNLIYQVHDGSVEEIEAVYDSGSSLTDEGDVADLRVAAAPSNGAFKTDEADGLFRLGATPSGTVTADVKGDNSGGYVSSAPDIFQRIVTRKSDLTTSDIDEASVNTATTRNSSVVGVSIPDESARLPDVLTAVMQSVGGWWTFGRDGRVKVGILTQPGSSVLTLSDEDIMPYGAISRVSPGRVIYRVRLGYDRTWTVQNEGSLAAALDADEKALRSQAYRYVTDEDASIQTSHALAEVLEKDTIIDVEANAQTEATRLLSLHGVRRDLYRIPVGWRLFKFTLGQTITLDIDRFDLPKDFVIVGIEENAARREASLTVWG